MYIPWYNLSTQVNEQENKDMNQNKNINLLNEKFETFTVDKKKFNSEYIIHKFQTNYQQIPNFFEYLFPYEFSSKTNKINNIRSH
jgi:hypothetical protein